MPQRSVASTYTFEQQRTEINLLAADFWSHKTAVDGAATSYLKHDGSNDFTGGTLAVPAAFTINSNSGAGTVTISGNLNVTGTTTTVNTTNLDVTDKNITIAKGNNADATADGAGITIDSATDITWNFVDANDAWVSSIGVEATTTLKVGGVASLHTAQFSGTTAPSAGHGVEIGAPDGNTGQVIVYDRDNSAYKQLNLKGSSVQLYAGTTNALAGTFNSTGLAVVGNIQGGGSAGVTGAWGQTDWNLEVYNSGGDAYGLIAGTSGAAIELKDTVTNESFVIAANGDCNLYSYLSGDSMSFHTTNGSGTGNRLSISSDGDVNIGPSANANGHGLLTLSQSASAAFNALVIQQGNTAYGATDGLQIGIDAGVHAYIKQYENRDIYFTTGNPNTTKLTIASGGGILIGSGNQTKTQDGVLIERNSSDGMAHITAGRSGGNYSGIEFYVAGVSGVTKRHLIDYQGNFRWYGEDGTSERLRIDTYGNATFTGTGGNVHTFTSNSYNVLDIVADSDNDEGNSDNIIRFRHGSGGSLSERAEIRYDESDAWLELSAGDNQNHLVIKSDGFVGVGVNPTAKFHVSSAYNQVGLKVAGGAHNGYSSPLQVLAANGDMRLEVSGDNGVQFTRGPVGGAEHVSNTPDMWQKIGIWKGANVDGAARCKITVMGTDTHDANGNVAGETIIYLAFGANHVLKGYFYSTTGQYPGLAGVAWNYDNNDSSNKKVEIWVKYDSAYGMTQCYADCSTGLFEGSNINTGLTSVPAGATEIESYFTIRTSNGTSSNERLRIQPNGQVCIGTNNHHDRDFVVNTGGNSAVYFGMTGTNSTQPWVNSTRPILSVGTDGTGWPGDGSTHSNKIVNFGIGGGAAGTSATIEHSHFAITLNGTIKSQHGIQGGGNATGGYQLNSQYSGKGYDIATQYATSANGGSNGLDPLFSGWWGSSNNFRVNTNGQIKFAPSLSGALISGNASISHSGNTKTFTIAGLVSGSVMFHFGTYSSAGQGMGGITVSINGYQTATSCYQVEEIQRWDTGSISVSSFTKWNSYCSFTVTNNHGSYTAGSNWHLWGNDEVYVTVA